LAAIVYVGIFPSVIATILWNNAVAQVGAGTAGVFTNLIPVFSLILAAILLSESITVFQFAGMGLIFTAIWVVSERRHLYRSRSGLLQFPTAAMSWRAKCQL
jgi:drug/metabolite transporter (DMT)-like permease